MSTIIAVSNQKGGVGKTTTCVSLGACLAEFGNRTLIVDLDSQANLTMSAGLDPDSLEYTLPDLLEDKGKELLAHPEKVIRSTLIKNLDILPSDLRLASAEQTLYNQENYEYRLKDLLLNWDSDYSFILIDCPPSLSLLTLMALTAAQMILVPVQCEYYSARGLFRLLDVIEAVKRHTNPDLGYRFVVTMFDKRNKISLQVYDQLYNEFKEKFLDTIIQVDTKLRESAVAGEPITAFSPHSRSSDAYRQLAKELITFLNREGI
jgi:chromosome partitioning protein